MDGLQGARKSLNWNRVCYDKPYGINSGFTQKRISISLKMIPRVN